MEAVWWGFGPVGPWAGLALGWLGLGPGWARASEFFSGGGRGFQFLLVAMACRTVPMFESFTLCNVIFRLVGFDFDEYLMQTGFSCIAAADTEIVLHVKEQLCRIGTDNNVSMLLHFIGKENFASTPKRSVSNNVVSSSVTVMFEEFVQRMKKKLTTMVFYHDEEQGG